MKTDRAGDGLRLSAVPVLSVVVPVLDERGNVRPLVEQIEAVVEPLAEPFEIVFVNDGSTDGTAEELRSLSSAKPHVQFVELTRNFGHQAALYAGLSYARGEAVVSMDGDGQHPATVIPQLVAKWREGFDVVQAIRKKTDDATWLKRATSRGFYRLLSKVAKVRVAPGAADFRLLTRRAVDAFLQCGELHRFNRGLVRWIGFAQAEVEYDSPARAAEASKYSLRAMTSLAGDALFSFSSWPLRLAGLAGAMVSLAAAGYLLWVLFAYFFTDLAQPGWSSILASVLVIGGMQLIVLWIIGEYLGRLCEEAKRRPLFLVRYATPGLTEVAPDEEVEEAVTERGAPPAPVAPLRRVAPPPSVDLSED